MNDQRTVELSEVTIELDIAHLHHCSRVQSRRHVLKGYERRMVLGLGAVVFIVAFVMWVMSSNHSTVVARLQKEADERAADAYARGYQRGRDGLTEHPTLHDVVTGR